ncbi:hypothetical protein MKZ38_004119 [Zalerion maritima]|uniref:Uncharacterized protein n=1 Tax=Zalerion maritima TaxID=339359 RepID=A0AAD5RMZ6_9PEZI|nr:hypothetical protein MKZ38_004119 [Zalerion maritima]
MDADYYALPMALDLSAFVPSGGLETDTGACTDAIVSLLKEVTLSKPGGSKISITWSAAIEATCYQLFSARDLERNLAFFCDRAHANIWFNSLEELVFQDEILLDDSISVGRSGAGDDNKVWRRLEAIQAAYLVCLIQNWEGSKLSKRRVRSHRRAVVLGAARGFGLGTVTRGQLRIEDISDFRWADFILLETLIRTGTYIFLLDSAFVIFHNSPPRLLVPEIRMSLACPDDCFQAPSVEECFVLLRVWTCSQPYQASLSVSETVEMLCGTSVIEEGLYERLGGLSILNMFTLITGKSSGWHVEGGKRLTLISHKAIHSLVFHFQTSLASHTELSHIQMGLNQWMLPWTQADHHNKGNHSEPCAPQDMWKRTGFMRHADEFRLLAEVTLNNMKHPLESGDSCISSLDTGNTRAAGLTYDESDMKQVRNLASAFQNLSFI